MKELRQGRRDQLRVGEVQLAELFWKLRGGLRVIRIDSQLHEERLDEAGIAALVHAGERPTQDPRRIAAHPVLGRGREADEFGEETALADARPPRDETDPGAAGADGRD